MCARGIAVLVVWSVACGDPDGTLDEPAHIYTLFGSDDQSLDAAGAHLAHPNDVAIDRERGTIYISDFNHFRVTALELDGDVHVVAGTGELGVPPVEGLASMAAFNHIGDLLLDGEGGLYLAAWHNCYVVHVDLASGMLARIAGQGQRVRYAGDGGAAIDAQLSLPAALALDAQGRVLVTDQENQVLRRIDRATGVIESFAGRCTVEPDGPCDAPVACPGSEKLACKPEQCSYPCTPGFSGDIATASDVRFAFPYGAQALPGGKLAVATDGSVLVADVYNDRVRAVRTDGRVETIAEVPKPYDIAVAPDGSLYVASSYESCIRRIGVDGAISTLAGTCGQRGFAGDGGLATAALLDWPLGIALDADAHRLYVADSGNNRIRYVTLP